MKKMVVFGATSVIAEAIIHQFAEEEIELYLIARQQKKLTAIVNDLIVRYPHVRLYTAIADFTNVERHPILLQKITDDMKSIDIALIAYGSLSNQRQCELSYEITLNELNTNFLSVISLLTHLANQMEKERHGLIAVISSVAGDRGRQSNYIYGTAKGGLNVFLQGLRNRLYKSNVHVLTIKPGLINTPMTRHIKKGPLWDEPVKIAKQIKKAIEKKYHSIYVPSFWAIVMIIICLLPERLFKKLTL